ncbi:MAG: 2'-5' RNA ligase family protein [Chloroflexota bacterium]
MVTPEPTSAIVARVPVPPALERLRRRWDLAAGTGVPAHVTILFPFLPAEALLAEVRCDLAAIAAAQQPFDVRFERVDRFPGVVYVPPEPATPFIRLTEAFAARFPDYPPYGGAFEVIIPHLTVAESADAPLDEIAAAARRALPFRHHVSTLEVLVESGEGRWRTRWRLPLGVRR